MLRKARRSSEHGPSLFLQITHARFLCCPWLVADKEEDIRTSKPNAVGLWVLIERTFYRQITYKFST